MPYWLQGRKLQACLRCMWQLRYLVSLELCGQVPKNFMRWIGCAPAVKARCLFWIFTFLHTVAQSVRGLYKFVFLRIVLQTVRGFFEYLFFCAQCFNVCVAFMNICVFAHCASKCAWLFWIFDFLHNVLQSVRGFSEYLFFCAVCFEVCVAFLSICFLRTVLPS